ncbi:unnamed protein product [Peniophora sp. CBMAI 1063]|nr:unnamed protein product [Peniophora sp. CBMAI 1063]
MSAVDPTYPLYPVACALSAAMLLLVLLVNFTRSSSWNLGVQFLCFWLCLENATSAANAIIWADNAEIKLYVYCDIVSHLRVITYVVKPMATLIITRRLYSIANVQSVGFPSKIMRRWELCVEWTLGLIIPLLVAGPIYYVNQGARFVVYEGVGCTNFSEFSILEILISKSWAVIPPLVSVAVYYPKVVRTYYRQMRDINSILRSHDEHFTRTSYTRILRVVLASIDIVLTLPIGIVTIAMEVVTALSPPKDFPFYPGWTYLHTRWDPFSYPYAAQEAFGTAFLAQNYIAEWTSPVLAFAIFGLFGFTSGARASYLRGVCVMCSLLGWRSDPSDRKRNRQLGEIEFAVARPQETISDIELGLHMPNFTETFALVPSQIDHCPQDTTDDK